VAIALNGSRTAILIGNGDGTFRAPMIITEPNLNIPHQQAVADFNGDGFQDLALSLADGNTDLMEILNGNGDGTFQPLVLYLPPPPTSVGGYAIVAADLNGDNKADITLGSSGAFPGFLVLINSTGVAPPATPSAPTLLSPAQDATPAQPVTLDWTDVSAATSYRIQVDDSSTFSTPLVVDRTLTASQFTAPTLAARRHWWRVRGINSAGTAGAWSSVRRFTPQAAASAPALSAIALSPTSVVGGNTSQGTATLTSAAPSGGAVVTLSSSNTSAATVPASVTIAAGATSVTFTVSTVSVTASTPVTITGASGGAASGAGGALGAVGEPDERHWRDLLAGDGHPDVGGAGGRVCRVAVEQQHCGGDGAGERVGGAGGDERYLRDSDERGYSVDAGDDHGERRRRYANGDRDGDSSGANGNADGDGDRPER
jgi:hypothetical protein